MGHFDEHLPEDVREIAERLTQARATLSPLESDELRGRIHRRSTRAPRVRRTGRFRRSSLAAILAAALMLSCSAGAVIAAGYFGGNDGGFRYVFQELSFAHDHDASYCQYHGPITVTRYIPTPFGVFIVTITYDCGRVIDVHISFIPFSPHGHAIPPFFWRFDNGPQQTANGTSVSTTAPTATTAMTITENGATYTLPFDFGNGSTQAPPPPRPSYSVSFSANGGTGSMASETANAPTPLTADSFTRTGYTFAGWGTSPAGGAAYADGATFPFTANAVLYAQWKPNPAYTVSFNANGGVGDMPSETKNVATALTPESFSRSGYTFAGWNTAANGSGTSYANDAIYGFTASATLYAQWAGAARHSPR